jgi:hypothetical protein
MKNILKNAIIILFLILNSCSSDIANPESSKIPCFMLDSIQINLTNKYSCRLFCQDQGFIECTMVYHFESLSGTIKALQFTPRTSGIGKISIEFNASEVLAEANSTVTYSDTIWIFNKFNDVDSCFVDYRINGNIWKYNDGDSSVIYDEFEYTGESMAHYHD